LLATLTSRTRAADADIASAQRACTDGEALLVRLRATRQGVEADVAAAQRGLADSEAALEDVKARQAEVEAAVREAERMPCMIEGRVGRGGSWLTYRLGTVCPCTCRTSPMNAPTPSPMTADCGCSSRCGQG
jgi:hypothetical protein